MRSGKADVIFQRLGMSGLKTVAPEAAVPSAASIDLGALF
jgi:hypothetical protein